MDNKYFFFIKIPPHIFLAIIITDSDLWEFNINAGWNMYSSQSPYLSELDFCNSSVWNIQFYELDF